MTIPADKHGTLTGYTYHKCRCATCVAYWSDYQHAYHLRRKPDLLALSAARYARDRKEILAKKKLRDQTVEGKQRSSRYVSARRARLLDAFVEDVDRETLWEEYNGHCAICGEFIDFELSVLWIRGESPRTTNCPSSDHIVPLSKGGKHSYENVQLAHFGCNLRKHAKQFRS